ncbi:hypothetical protein [Agromyces sp. NPDC058126]|uniref:hypothetical protein n=1 Tax=Agromyces sp. NPDC058126 TaxID=3346350 RepID=UPI0036D9F557
MMDERLFQVWVHSREEDHDGVTVYRPAGYALPPARGRTGIEFRPDGTLVEHGIGRDDTAESRPGGWHLVGADRLALDGVTGDSRSVRIVSIEDDRLEVSEESPPP